MNRGQAQFIGWVLLIGFAVVLSTFVGNWVLQQARETTQGMIDMTSKDIKCADVSIALSCKKDANQNIIGIEIINTGYFTIQLAGYEGENYEKIPRSELLPHQSKSLSADTLYTTVVPLVKTDDKLVGCAEKQIEVKCSEE